LHKIHFKRKLRGVCVPVDCSVVGQFVALRIISVCFYSAFTVYAR